MIQRLIHINLLVCILFISGCADPTYPHREALALGLTKATAWKHPDIESIPAEMQRMHLGAGHAAATADACENCLETNPPFDAELIAIIQAYAKSSRELEAQFNKAIADGRAELNDAEKEIALKCTRNDLMLNSEILGRIKYNQIARSE